MQETLSAPDQDGNLATIATIAVQVVRPDKVRIERTRIPKLGPSSVVAVYVADGKQTHVYDPETRFYQTDNPRLTSDASLDMVLNPDSLSEGTISEDTIDGKPMVVSTQSSQAKNSDQRPIQRTVKVWIDARTGLPYRRAEFVTQLGKTNEVEQFDYTKWTLDQPIDSSRFAWNPPADAKKYAKPTLLAEGTMAPDFAVETPDGKTVHLSDFKGKPVVIDFWATWCAPCVALMPRLEGVYQKTRDQDVEVLAICAWDDRDAYNAWVKQNIGTKYHFLVAFDPAGRNIANSVAMSLFGVSSMPAQYVIDKDGKVASARAGYRPIDTALEQNLSAVGVKTGPS